MTRATTNERADSATVERDSRAENEKPHRPGAGHRLRWPNALSADASSGGPRSSLSGGAYSTVDNLEPALLSLLEECEQRILGGEVIDIENLAAAHPAWAVKLRWLIPPIQNLAELGHDLEARALAPTWDDSETAAQRAFRNFRIIREVGRGGMGIVYEAKQAALGRHVALKVLPLATALDPRALQRFQLEAQVAGWLQHPRIVPVYAVGLVGDVPYFAMRFIEGGSLAEVIAELRQRTGGSGTHRAAGETPANGKAAPPADSQSVDVGELANHLLSGRFAPLRRDSSSGRVADAWSPDISRDGTSTASIRSRTFIRTIVRLGIQAAEALDYAHGQGVVHRDIKPANLLLDRQGDIWIADFGMADVQGNAGLTMTGDMPGTLRYMSPEQALGKRSLVDRRTDIYSLGATLYELLTLQPAVTGNDRQEILLQITDGIPASVRRLNPAVPADLATVVAKTLAKEPSSRYETAGQLAADLGRFLEGRPILARPVGPLARTWRWCRRKPTQAGLAAALVLAIIGGFAGVTWAWRDAVLLRRAAQAAEAAATARAEKSDATNRFLFAKIPQHGGSGYDPLAARAANLAVLDRAAAEVGGSFGDKPEIEASIRVAIARNYHSLEAYEKSEAQYRAAEVVYSRIPGEDTLAVRAEHGHSLAHLRRLDEAETLLTPAFEEMTRSLGPTNPTTIGCGRYMAALYEDQKRYADAEAVRRRLLATLRDVKGPDHPDTLTALDALGHTLHKQERYGEAEQIFRECLERKRAVFGPRHPSILISFRRLGEVLKELGRLAQAEAILRECLKTATQVRGSEEDSTLQTMAALASVLEARGRLDEAERLLRRCIAARHRHHGNTDPEGIEVAAQLDRVVKQRARLAAHGPVTISRTSGMPPSISIRVDKRPSPDDEDAERP